MISFAIVSILMSLILPRFQLSLAETTLAQTYIEGDHIRFYLTDTATNSSKYHDKFHLGKYNSSN